MIYPDSFPGNISPIYSRTRWMELVFKTNLSSDHKLVAVVISNSSSYVRRYKASISEISNYSISRVLNLTQDSVQKIIDDLMRLGWLVDSEKRLGSRGLYYLTMSVYPLGDFCE